MGHSHRNSITLGGDKVFRFPVIRPVLRLSAGIIDDGCGDSTVHDVFDGSTPWNTVVGVRCGDRVVPSGTGLSGPVTTTSGTGSFDPVGICRSNLVIALPNPRQAHGHRVNGRDIGKEGPGGHVGEVPLGSKVPGNTAGVCRRAGRRGTGIDQHVARWLLPPDPGCYGKGWVLLGCSSDGGVVEHGVGAGKVGESCQHHFCTRVVAPGSGGDGKGDGLVWVVPRFIDNNGERESAGSFEPRIPSVLTHSV